MNIIKTSVGTSFAQVDFTKTSDIAKRESNDCVVRAIASCMSIPYDEAHSWVKEAFGRRDRRGTCGTYHTFKSKAESRFGINIEEMGEVLDNKLGWRRYTEKVMIFRYNRGGEVCFGKLTMARFLKKYNIGTYFVLVNSHALTVIDGVIYGNFSDSTRMKVTIESAFKINKGVKKI